VAADLSITQILVDLEAQIRQLEAQEAFQAQQEDPHREQRALRAGGPAEAPRALGGIPSGGHRRRRSRALREGRRRGRLRPPPATISSRRSTFRKSL
jgi:hypothetical protein